MAHGGIKKEKKQKNKIKHTERSNWNIMKITMDEKTASKPIPSLWNDIHNDEEMKHQSRDLIDIDY